MSSSDQRHSWSWLCPWAMLGLAVGILALLGLSVWTALLTAILLVCPTIMVWGAIQALRHPRNED